MSMLIDATATSSSVPTAAYSVDTSKGSVNGEVSKQWMARPGDERFDTLTDLFNAKKAYHDAATEYRCATDSDSLMLTGPDDVQSLADMERLYLHTKIKNGGDVQRVATMSPTHYSFTQLCRLADAPASYMRKMPTPIVADSLNYNLHYQREREAIKLLFNDEQLHAATGPNYGRIPDHEIVRALMNMAGDGKGDSGHHWKAPGKLNWANGTYDPEDMGPREDRTFYGSDRDMFVFLVDDRRPIVVGKTRDGHDDHMFRGFYVQNSMVGARSLKIVAFYLRGVCMNRNLWGCEGFEEITIRHTSMAMDRWLEQAKPALESFSQASDRKLIESVQQAKAAKLAENDEAAVAFLKARNFSQFAIKSIMEESEVHEGTKLRTAWDFAQGITRFAQTKINTDDRLDVELEAKRILDKVA